MNSTVGRVFEIYIPDQYKNGSLLDVMDRTNITLKVMTNNGVREVTVEQDDDTAKIMKNDLVEIIEQNISGTNFIDIKLYEGEDYEW